MSHILIQVFIYPPLEFLKSIIKKGQVELSYITLLTLAKQFLSQKFGFIYKFI